MATELSILPTSITAGESFTATLPSTVTVTGRTCVYQFKAPVPFSVTCAAGETQFVLSVTAAQSLTLKAGNIYFAAFATTTSTGAVACVDSGYLTVAPNPLATSSYSTALAAVEAAIANYAANPNKRVSLGTMSLEYRDLDDLIALKSYYQSEIARDLTGRGNGPFRISPRFAW